ncbi:MAG: sigma-70 family RNA polymerase sigma factor [Bacteroidales bacterium]|jgi:RNA polymerase sigma-70 factor (ECF subfamily)|nr:sigma-70 family RNA polymerase sigma factor [Bacteroidales bacterium]
MEVKETTYNVVDKFSDKAKADFQLVTMAQGGDQKAFTKLLSKYRESVYFMIAKMVKNHDDAEDLTMDSFGRAFRNISLYKPTSAFSTWLFRIASNNAIDYIRTNRQKTISIDKTQEEENETNYDAFPALIEGSKDPEENMISVQKSRIMRSVVDQLPEDYKHITEMRYFQEKSYIEISKELDLPIGTVKARLFRSRELLLAILRDRNFAKDNFK